MKAKYALVIFVLVVFLFACSPSTAEVEVTATALPGVTDTPAAETPLPAQPTPEALSERPGHVWDADRINLAEYAHRSFLQIPVGMTWGPDGYLYVADWTGRHVVRVNKQGEMDDLALWKTIKPLQNDGPRGIDFDSEGNLYLNNHGSIFRLDTQGEVQALTGVFGSPIGSLAFSPADELYYTDRGGGRLFKWNPAGKVETIAEGLPMAENLVFGLDGTLYLTQMGKADLLKVNLDTGESEVFAPGVCSFDPCYLAVDPEGDIWTRGIWHMHQISPDGTEKPFQVDGQTYPGGQINWHTAAGIAFDDEGALWVASYNSKLQRLVPVTPDTPDPEFTLQVIYPGFEASDLKVDSTGAVYAVNENNWEVLKIKNENDVQVLLQQQTAGRGAVALDENSVLYLGMPYGKIMRLEEDGSLTEYANLLTRRMVFGGDGVLYAVVGNYGQPKYIVGLTDIDTFTTLASEIDGIPLGDGEVHITPALDQGLYVITERERNLFFLDFEGQGYLIANLGNLGGGGPICMAASPVSGDIFYVPHGPYIVYRIDPDGKPREFAYNVFGDPWGMVVSQDGKWLYVAESGAIDKIAIPEN
ncbi:MAG: NHL repeat-containing protein [Anaerolineales bacterium]